MRGFELIDHTADTGLKAYGRDLKELFQNAARGMFEIIADVETIGSGAETSIEVAAPTREGLLHAWLTELNYFSITRREIYRATEISEMNSSHIKAVAVGERIGGGGIVHTEIKAVTWHDLYVKETPLGFEAQVIFDL